MGYDIFLSYSHLDRHIAEELGEKFEGRGLKCFLAPESIRPGAEWLLAIHKGIQESERVLILITPRSVESKWVYIEAGAAWMENKTIIPLTQFVEVSDLPEAMKHFQTRPIETEAQRLALINEMPNRCTEGADSSIRISLDLIREQIEYAKSNMEGERFEPDLFIGSGKGGAICAGMFACRFAHSALKVLDLQFRGIDERTVDYSSLKKSEILRKNVLVVEWVRQTGRTFQLIKDKVSELHPAKLRSYALFWTRHSEAPDYCGITCDKVPYNDYGIY